MAGGIGSRFWPMSRTNYPKQFIDILGTGKSLLRQTYDRFAKKFPAEEYDTFYSHTQRAFSKGNHCEHDGKTYVFNFKKVEKNRLQVR